MNITIDYLINEYKEQADYADLQGDKAKETVKLLQELKELRENVENDKWFQLGRIDGILECLKIVKNHANEYDGIWWVIRELGELKDKE